MKCNRQLIARRTTYLRSSGKDVADLSLETLAWFTPQWEDLSLRLQIVPGKEVLRAFREKVQALLNVSLGDARIVDAIHRPEIPPDLEELIRGHRELSHVTSLTLPNHRLQRTRHTAPRR